MPRKSRVLLSGKVCHNIVQGINKEYIFKENQDKIKYLNLLRKYYEEYKIDIICYCIMNNHTHLILYSEEIKNISMFMKRVNSIYAMYYNKKYNRVGYVFRDRYKSILILSRKQLYKCIKYIHMNPVKANIVKNEWEYLFSSYKDYFNKSGFLNQRILDFLFYKSQNYIEKFKSIPYEDIYNEKVKIKEILKKYLNDEKIGLDNIMNERKKLEKFLLYFENYKYSKLELANILGISKATLYRKIRKVKKENETKIARP